jgi:hypothetical protein
MSGDAVQKEYVSGCKSGAIEIGGEDFCSKGKMLVLEQEAPFKNAIDEDEFVGAEGVMVCGSVVD